MPTDLPYRGSVRSAADLNERIRTLFHTAGGYLRPHERAEYEQLVTAGPTPTQPNDAPTPPTPKPPDRMSNRRASHAIRVQGQGPLTGCRDQAGTR